MKHTVSAIGDGAIEVVDRIGRKRALIGLAILAAATAGAIVAVKLLRRRHDEGDDVAEGAPDGRARRGKRRAANPNGASAGAR